MTIQTYPDRELMMVDVANTVAGDLNGALLTHDRVTLAVPGGTTPGPVFDTLSAVRLDWSRVDVLPTDERWVPEDHPRSNAGMIRRRLLAGAAAAATLVPLYRDGATPEEAAPDIAAEIERRLPLSVLLLGMGEDMHTASLFPGAEGLEAAMVPDAPAVVPIRTAAAEDARVTLSARVLDEAMAKHILITGAAKREALDRAGRLDATEAPIRQVWRGAAIHWSD